MHKTRVQKIEDTNPKRLLNNQTCKKKKKKSYQVKKHQSSPFTFVSHWYQREEKHVEILAAAEGMTKKEKEGCALVQSDAQFRVSS